MLCIDQDAPFKSKHIGKIPAERTHRTINPEHCVALVDGQQRIVRFITSEAVIGENSPRDLRPDMLQVGQQLIHHLGLLSRVGVAVTPVNRTGIGPHSVIDPSGADGLYIVQDLLPDRSENLMHAIKCALPSENFPNEAWKTTKKQLAEYFELAMTEHEPAVLKDISTSYQYSVTREGIVILHDIEPWFTDIKAYRSANDFAMID